MTPLEVLTEDTLHDIEAGVIKTLTGLVGGDNANRYVRRKAIRDVEFLACVMGEEFGTLWEHYIAEARGNNAPARAVVVPGGSTPSMVAAALARAGTTTAAGVANVAAAMRYPPLATMAGSTVGPPPMRGCTFCRSTANRPPGPWVCPYCGARWGFEKNTTATLNVAADAIFLQNDEGGLDCVVYADGEEKVLATLDRWAVEYRIIDHNMLLQAKCDVRSHFAAEREDFEERATELAIAIRERDRKKIRAALAEQGSGTVLLAALEQYHPFNRGVRVCDLIVLMKGGD